MKVFSCRSMGINVKRMLYEGVFVFITICEAETWSMTVVEDKILDIMKMRCMKTICGVKRMN